MASELVYSAEGDWHHWNPPKGFKAPRPSASSKSRNNNRKRRARLRAQTLERDGYVCTYCGEEATIADHIVPLAKGGEDTLENLTAACVPCNSTLGRLGL